MSPVPAWSWMAAGPPSRTPHETSVQKRRTAGEPEVAVKIVNVETFLVPPRWLFCRVETDEGVVGWGEPVVEGRAEAVRATVHVLAEYLMGQDPLRIEDHWQVMANGGFYRGGPV